MRSVGIVVARMGSERLPGKMAVDVHGKPALIRVFERLRNSRELDEIILATTVDSEDETLCRMATEEGVRVFRGSRDDVLGRVSGAATFAEAEVVAEITGDCLLLDWNLLDDALAIAKSGDYDYATNILAEYWSYPHGADAMVFRASAPKYGVSSIHS